MWLIDYLDYRGLLDQYNIVVKAVNTDELHGGIESVGLYVCPIRNDKANPFRNIPLIDAPGTCVSMGYPTICLCVKTRRNEDAMVVYDC